MTKARTGKANKKIVTYDSAEQIEKCLNCPYAKCSGNLYACGQVGRRPHVSHKKIAAMLSAGTSRAETSKTLGVSEETVKRVVTEMRAAAKRESESAGVAV